jgi:very-short-patch-repair endonuclease
MKKSKRANSLRLNSTDVERKLWARLRNRNFYNIKFRRQHPIDRYILDFICVEKKIIIELDGGQHNFETHKIKDEIRDNYFIDRGYKILRFWNNEVNENLDGVLTVIANECGVDFNN